MAGDLKIKKVKYKCGYCGLEFIEELVYEQTPLGVKLRDKRICCDRCDNYLNRDEWYE